MNDIVQESLYLGHWGVFILPCPRLVIRAGADSESQVKYQQKSHFRTISELRVVIKSSASGAANFALMLGSRVGKFINCVASDWLEHPMTASDWLLMLRGANRETCNRKLKHQQRLTYLAKTATTMQHEKCSSISSLSTWNTLNTSILICTDF